MNDMRYKWMFYVITFVILSTIGIQVYWNYKNYQTNKQQLINDVQVSLDNAVDSYYTNLAEYSAVESFSLHSNSKDKLFDLPFDLDSLINERPRSNEFKLNKDLKRLARKSVHNYHKQNSRNLDSIRMESIFHNPDSIVSDSFQFGIKRIKLFDVDSPTIKDINLLTSKVFIAITRDSLSLGDIDGLLKSELSRKKINIIYGLTFESLGLETQKLKKINPSHLSTNSKSPFLPRGSSLSIHFSNETKIILKRILTGILISTLLVLAVIGCLFYLLQIIRRQKQLAEVKNDLISNITHEFKTPIATISVALESLKSFDGIDDKKKTKTYLDMSSEQLTKLNVMVEKLLETATLDSGNLELHKTPINVIDLLHTIVDKHQMQTESTTLIFDPKQTNIEVEVDVFHFENAINNIIDNAIKYGGNQIWIEVSQNAFLFTISISDNGTSLKMSNKDQIFEKFYRVSKGNTHNVKGFGIGLYYTKKIVEKHSGTIQLELKKTHTTFKLTLPNES
jgi:two-component system phosphate regulon sensor histidine kinase PhoR